MRRDMRVKGFQNIVLAVCALFFLGSAAQAEMLDRIVAVVNDDIITLTELNTAFAPYEDNIVKSYKGQDLDKVLRQQKGLLLQQMIDALLIEQEAKKAGPGIAVSDGEIDEVLRDMLAKNKVTLDEYMKRLAAEGQTLQKIKKEIRSQMLRMRLLRREVQARVLVTDEEIGRYYDSHRGEYEGKEAVRIFQILLPVPEHADEATQRKIRVQALEIRKRIVNGEPFEEMLRQGPVAAQAGDVGFIERGTILPEVEQAAFGLEKDQVSDVIQTEVGLHIIRVVDKRGAGFKPLTVVREEIKTRIEDEKVAKKYDEWIADVRKRAFVDIKL
ncbi:MAG: peptidylprolyl isomerase [Smithellaceae bacterium]